MGEQVFLVKTEKELLLPYLFLEWSLYEEAGNGNGGKAAGG